MVVREEEVKEVQGKLWADDKLADERLEAGLP